MSIIGMLGVFCGSATLSGVLLSLHFFFSKKAKKGVGIMLGLLFLSISMRIAKSLWHYVLFDFAKVGVGQGFVALAMIGPALLFYLFSSASRPIRKMDYLHWIWPLLALVLAIIEPISFRFLYKYGTGLIIVYIILGAWIHWRTKYDSKQLMSFNRAILVGVFLIAISFVFQHSMGGLLYYTYGAAFASLIIYFMLFMVLTNSLVIVNSETKEVTDDTFNQLKRAFEEQKIFLMPGITLSGFAVESNIPTYLISPSVNKAYNMTFPEAINHFRVIEVKRRLQNGDHKKLKIEGLAAEAGFTTPSVFYAAFKKETGMTPTQFQKTLQ